MNETPECTRLRALLAEVATGASTGEERAIVLSHVAWCVTCRQELSDLSRIADELLLLVPQRQPPPGFEAAVVRRMAAATSGQAARSRLHPRWRPALRFAAATVAILLAASAGVGTTLWQTAPDRQLADEYRHVMTIASGQSVRAVQVSTEDGQVVGHIVLFQGTPSWMIVALTDAPVPGDYTMTIVTNDGYRYTAGICRVADRTATVGYGLPMAVTSIAAIELTQPSARLIAYPG